MRAKKKSLETHQILSLSLLTLVLIQLCSAQHTGNDKVPLRRLTGEVDERFKHTLREMSCTCSDLPALVILHTDPTCTEQLKSALFALGHFVAINKVEPDVATKRMHHFAGARLSAPQVHSVARSCEEKGF